MQIFWMQLRHFNEVLGSHFDQMFTENFPALREVHDALFESLFVPDCLEELKAAGEITFFEELQIDGELEWISHQQLISLFKDGSVYFIVLSVVPVNVGLDVVANLNHRTKTAYVTVIASVGLCFIDGSGF